MRRRLEADAGTPVANSPQEFAAFVKADVPRWAKLVRYAGATPD
jgi:tripartite-type tricarboxylate transporter receptor subunit TctC